jgi:transposase
MEEQKKNIIEFVRDQKGKGQSITESLKALGIKRSTYYSWLNPKQKKQASSRAKLTPCEQQAIEETKERYPNLRHRQIQGILQNQGVYLSYSSVYHHLKSINRVEPYERRPSPLKEPRYHV